MKRFNKILVILEMTEQDRQTLEMTSRLAAWTQPQEIVICHFSPEVLPSADVKEKHPWVGAAVDKAAISKLQELAQELLTLPANTSISYQIDSTHPVRGALAIILRQDIDLVVVGSDPISNAIRLARKATCSVCIVPKHGSLAATKPLVPVDFSEHARLACEIAHDLTTASGSGPAEIVHISQILGGHRWSNISREEYLAMNESHANLAMDQFLLGLGRPTGTTPHHIHHHESIPFGILEFAATGGYNMLVAGCRGKDALSALLLGSDIEQVIRHADIPIFAVKIKGTGRSFVQELLGMDD